MSYLAAVEPRVPLPNTQYPSGGASHSGSRIGSGNLQLYYIQLIFQATVSLTLELVVSECLLS